jgi:predicted 3-demethylubiquinone-9 3-methyltransferase (glyoxalase superfamily)
MSTRFQRIAPFLWFNDQAEEAAAFYTSIFDNARIVTTTRYNKESGQATGRPEGSVMTVAFELDDQQFTALNGGPVFKFNEAVSLVVNCKSQEEVDHYWNKLSAGGDEKAQQCGWLKDRYGVSWQVVPTLLIELLSDPDPKKAHRVSDAMMKMKKIDLDKLRQAAA